MAGTTSALSFTNDIALPSTMYVLADTQSDFFVKPMIKRWRPHDDFVRFSMNAGNKAFMRRLSTVASVSQPSNGMAMSVSLVNGDEFETIKTLRSALRVGTKGVGSGAVVAQVVGDSYTQGSFYLGALGDTNKVPGLTLVGLRRKGTNVHDEGRGGWALSGYFNVPMRVKPWRDYHPFMQPEGEHRYWGSREFWLTAWQCVKGTQNPGFEPLYSCGGYHDCVGRFDEKTGTLRNPLKGDVQFDGESGKFVEFSGTEWTQHEKGDYQWAFDYGKYLEMWNMPKPQFLFVLLGLNDFRGDIYADFTEWGKRITLFKDAYLKACPSGKFAICIPCSTCGTLDNAAGDFTEHQNAAMWRFRKWLIDTFDHREAEGFYLVDTGIGTDNDNGYNEVQSTSPIAAPFVGADDTVQPLKVQTGNPHPYRAYAAMGNPLAAFIQYYRVDK